jgi:L-2-amino-thiazoline-4-carboxylic acid hydrolase
MLGAADAERRMSEVESLRVQLESAMKARAMVYAAVYDELEAELGAAKAEAIMKRAIHKRGLAIGAQFARFGPRDIEGLRAAFMAFIPDGGRPFAPEVTRCDAAALDIKFHACPLKTAWLEAGMSAERVAQLCSIAGVVDNGTFEAAGFAFHADTWRPGEEGCCFLHIRPRGGR